MDKIFRNFFVIIRSYVFSSVMNVIGLALVFAVAILVAMQVDFEYGYDRHTANADRIYRVELRFGEEADRRPLISLPAAELVAKASPHIQGYAVDDMWIRKEIYVSADKANFSSYFYQQVSPEFFSRLTTPEVVEGSLSALEDPNAVAISRHTAEQIFGTAHGVLGRTLDLKLSDGTSSATIGLVYEDFALNSVFRNSVYQKFSDTYGNAGQWNNSCMNLYVLLDDSKNLASAMEAAETEFGKVMKDAEVTVFATPLRDIYFAPKLQLEEAAKGNRTTTRVMILVAMLVVLISCVNFVNFSIAIAPLRVKSIHIHKIYGSSIAGLRLMIISETVLFCLIAGVISVFLILAAKNSFLQELMSVPIDLIAHPELIGAAFLALVGIGVVAGLFPAFYLTSDTRGKGTQSLTGRLVRNVLIGFQYTISVTLVIVSIFMWQQREFVSRKDLGFDYRNILITQISDDLAKKQRDVLAEKLKASPLIEDVAFTSSPFPTSGPVGSLGRPYKDKSVGFNVIGVSWNFPALMGIYIKEGRDYQQTDLLPDRTGYATWLFNEKAQAMYDITVGSLMDNGEIAGITTDYNYQSLGNTVDPIALMCHPQGREWGALRHVYCKFTGDLKEATQLLMRQVKELEPGVSVEIKTLEEKIDRMYVKERNQVKFIAIFTLLAILISLSGVLSLILMEIKNRTKEIGVRKIHGATSAEILAIFNRKFLVIAVVCSVFAFPFAYYGTQTWLSQFVYKIELQGWVYLAGSLLVLLMTVWVVTQCCWQAANANPAKSIKVE